MDMLSTLQSYRAQSETHCCIHRPCLQVKEMTSPFEDVLKNLSSVTIAAYQPRRAALTTVATSWGSFVSSNPRGAAGLTFISL